MIFFPRQMPLLCASPNIRILFPTLEITLKYFRILCVVNVLWQSLNRNFLNLRPSGPSGPGAVQSAQFATPAPGHSMSVGGTTVSRLSSSTPPPGRRWGTRCHRCMVPMLCFVVQHKSLYLHASPKFKFQRRKENGPFLISNLIIFIVIIIPSFHNFDDYSLTSKYYYSLLHANYLRVE